MGASNTYNIMHPGLVQAIFNIIKDVRRASDASAVIEANGVRTEDHNKVKKGSKFGT